MLLCHCHSHVSSPFWPLEDMVQDVPFTNEEDDDTGYDYLCPRTQAPVSPTVMRPSTLDPLNIPRQVVVLSPLLTRKVRARLSLFCDAWRRRKCNDWVCNVLEVGFRLQFQECPLDEFVDKGSIKKCTTLRSLIQSMQQNVVEVSAILHLPGVTVTSSLSQRSQEVGV